MSCILYKGCHAAEKVTVVENAFFNTRMANGEQKSKALGLIESRSLQNHLQSLIQRWFVGESLWLSSHNNKGA